MSAIAGCGEDRAVPTGTGAGASGGNGGSAGEETGGGAGSPGAGGFPADGGTSGGGAPGGEGGSDSGEGGVGIPPIDEACSGDRAFAAVSGAFVDPTPQDLALALNEAILDVAPMSFVLRGGSDMAKAAASYTIVGDGAHSFLDTMAPDFVPAWIAQGGFGTSSAQPRGYLLIELDDGPLEVPLDNVSFLATTRDRCTRGLVSMNGVIPAENADLVARITGTDTSAARGSESRIPEAETTVSALFSVELVDFDFGALP